MNTRARELRGIILRYRANPTTQTLRGVEGHIKPFLAHCLKSGGYRVMLSEQQIADIVDESMIVVDRQIRDFRWICQSCRASFGSESEWQRHLGVHDVEPLQQIEVVVKTKAKFWALSQAKITIRRDNRHRVYPGVEACGACAGAKPDLELRIDLERAVRRWGFTLQQMIGEDVEPNLQRRIRRRIRSVVDGTYQPRCSR